MMIFFPLWLLGMGIYRLSHLWRLSAAAGRAIFFTGVLLSLIAEAYAAHIHAGFGFGSQDYPELWPLYAAGVMFAVITIGFCFADLPISRRTRSARWGAGASATLYLLHFPLGRFMNGIIPNSFPKAERWSLIVFSIIVITLLVAQVTERKKAAWRRAIEARIAALEARKPFFSRKSGKKTFLIPGRKRSSSRLQSKQQSLNLGRGRYQLRLRAANFAPFFFKKNGFLLPSRFQHPPQQLHILCE